MGVPDLALSIRQLIVNDPRKQVADFLLRGLEAFVVAGDVWMHFKLPVRASGDLLSQLVMQLAMVTVVLFNPGLVSGQLVKGPVIDATKALEEMGFERPDDTFQNPFETDPSEPAEIAEPAASAPALPR